MTFPSVNAQSILRLIQHTGIILCLVFAIAAGGCGGGSSPQGDGGDHSSATEGTLSVALSDTATDEYSAVYVTIARVDVLSNAETTWKTVADTPTTCNLLELVNGEHLPLGETSLKEGIYSQMRLVLDTEPATGNNILNEQHPYPHYTISTETDETRELNVPGALSSGINLISRFAINGDEKTDLVIDFDATRSIIHTGGSRQILKPVLRAFEPEENAIVSGSVRQKSSPSQEVERCYISVQQSLGTDEGDDLIAPVGGTLSSPEGNYSLLLEPGDDYTLVGFKQGYQTQCFNIADPQTDATFSLNFSLEKLSTAPGSISGEVTIPGSDADQPYAAIQVRRHLTCQNENGSSSNQSVIVKTVNVADRSNYSIQLPPGTYQLLATAPENPLIPPTLRHITLRAGSELIQHFRLQ